MTTASLATIPGREAALRRAVESLLPQVDNVYVYLNGHQRPPEICRHPRVLWGGTCAGGQDYGDAAKFAYPALLSGRYVLTCDDDLVYAPGYAAHMIGAAERYGRRSVVSLHGVRLQEPIVSYYGRTGPGHEKFRCLEALAQDEPVHVPGTGCLCYHADTVRFGLDDFPAGYPNMADIHAGVALQRAGVGAVAVAHPAGLVVQQRTPPGIWERAHQDDRLQVERLRSVAAWKLYTQTEEVTA